MKSSLLRGFNFQVGLSLVEKFPFSVLLFVSRINTIITISVSSLYRVRTLLFSISQ